MGLDIRLPIGVMFTLLGGILTIFGALADKAIYQRSLGINVNLGWGLVMMIFGLVMLRLGRRGTSAAHSAEDSPSAQKPEQAEPMRDPAENPERPRH